MLRSRPGIYSVVNVSWLTCVDRNSPKSSEATLNDDHSREALLHKVATSSSDDNWLLQWTKILAANTAALPELNCKREKEEKEIRESNFTDREFFIPIGRTINQEIYVVKIFSDSKACVKFNTQKSYAKITNSNMVRGLFVWKLLNLTRNFNALT